MIYNGVDTLRGAASSRRTASLSPEIWNPRGASDRYPGKLDHPEKGIGDLLKRRLVRAKSATQPRDRGRGAARDDYVRFAARIGIEDHVT
jgi:hypothetical protein